MADNDGRAWLAEHKERAEHLIWLFYALAILSAIGLIVPAKWPKSSLPIAIAVLLLGLISLGTGGYIAYAGGRIRHREFRTESPPKQLPNQILPRPHRLLHPAAVLPVPQRRSPSKRSNIRRRLLKSKEAKRLSGRITI